MKNYNTFRPAAMHTLPIFTAPGGDIFPNTMKTRKMVWQQSNYSCKVSVDFVCMHYTVQQCFIVIAPAFRLSWTSSNAEYMETYVFTLANLLFHQFGVLSSADFTQCNQYLPIHQR